MTQKTDGKPDRGEAKHDDPARKGGPHTGDRANPGNAQDEMGKRLDEGLEETFPSSDPVSVKITK